MRSILRAVGATAILASLMQPASAQWHGGVGASVRYLSNTEYDATGRRLVREEGWLPGIAARVAYQARGAIWFTEGVIYDRAIAYHGHTQAGAPANSTTSTRLIHLRIGGMLALTDSAAAFAALEREKWTRAIKSTPGAAGLQENYVSRRLLAGVQGKWDRTGAGTIGADAALVLSGPERLQVGFSGLVDPAALDTRSATGWRIGASIRPAFGPRVELRTALESIKVARSGDTPVTRNGQFIGTIAQPEHAKRAITVTASSVF